MQVKLAPGQTDISERPDLAKLQKELEQATAAHKSATLEVEGARLRETQARNRLNAAQKKIDEAIKVLRLTAPRGSDWTELQTRLQGERSA